MTEISIHALLAESDLGNVEAVSRMWNFYPRSPCGERPSSVRESLSGSTISIHALLAESDTHPVAVPVRVIEFSIHALLAESDALAPEENPTQKSFLSTLSLRRATPRA